MLRRGSVVLLLGKSTVSASIATSAYKYSCCRPGPTNTATDRARGTMAVLTALIFITANLIGSFCASPQACKLLTPRKIDVTCPMFTGKWYLIRWVTQYEPYQKQYGLVNNVFLINTPIAQMNQTMIKAYMRIGNNCTSESEVCHLSTDGLELACESKPGTVLTVLNSKIQNSLIFHVQDVREGKKYNTVDLYHRNTTGVEDAVKEFEDQVECLGMKKDKIFVLAHNEEVCDPQDTEEATSQK
ncbi:uncharacterized protein LOC144685519 [Cetorhinus maximus]